MANEAIVKLYGALTASTGFLQLELENYRLKRDEKNQRIADSIEGQIGLNNAALELAREQVTA